MASRVTTFIVVLIVVGTLIAGYMVGAERADEDGPVDLIITNAQVFTGGPGGELAEAIAIRADKILKVGSNRDIKRLRRPHTLTLDAHGATVLPGFNDSHAHLLSGGLAHLAARSDRARSRSTRSRTRFARTRGRTPIVRGSAGAAGTTSRSRACRRGSCSISSCPIARVYLEAYDGHTGWANSKALAAAHITRRTKNPPHGTIVKDPRTGEPTGALVESAMDLVDAVGPQPTRDEKLQAIRDAIALAHTVGVTSVQNASGTAEDFGLYDTLRRNGELELRVYQALSGSSSLTSADLDAIRRGSQAVPGRSASEGGRGEALRRRRRRIADGGNAGAVRHEQDRRARRRSLLSSSRALSRTLDARGWQVFAHAIGDRAIRMTLDAYQHAAQVNPASDRGRRHRIEHIETLDPADLPRFASIGVVASMQPDHGDPAPDLITVWKTTLGDERASRGWMYGSLLGAGAHVAFGSDWPVVSLDPRFGLHVATTRTSPNGEPEGGWIPNEKISLADALRAYTAGGAWASFDEQRKGTLKPGMLADVIDPVGRALRA